MIKWLLQKHTQNNTKHAEHQDATDVQKKKVFFDVFSIFFLYNLFMIS